MSFLNSLNQEDLNFVSTKLEPVTFKEGDLIIEEGSDGNGCYFLDEGRVRVEVDTGETDTDVVLNYLEPGQVMGEFSLLDQQPRSASLFAHTDVKARWLSTDNFQALLKENPVIGTKLLQAISLNLINIVRNTNKQLADFMAYDASNEHVDKMVSDGLKAQQQIQHWTENKIDALLKDLVDIINQNAESLAKATVEESGMGVVQDKINKIGFASQKVYDLIQGKSGAGLLQHVNETNIDEFASPMGVVLGIIPLTNPVPTMIFKTLICIKSRNALIMSCHRNALSVGNQAGELMQSVLKKHNAPIELIQWIKERSSRKVTNMFMRHKDISFILATGGPSIVKAAYSSGTPAIGVGAGNAPVLITETANLDITAKAIVDSKSFDNGVICGSDNNLIVEESVRNEFIKALKKNGAKILDSQEVQQILDHAFDPKTGKLSRELVGQSAATIAKTCGFNIEKSQKLIVAPLPLSEVTGPLGQEKLAPLLPLFTVKNTTEAFRVCKQILEREGSGHTAIIHTSDKDLANAYGQEMPASRILVNTGGSFGCIGFGNGLLPSLTLGCGTLGGTSTTDNVTYTNLMNIKRVAHAL